MSVFIRRVLASVQHGLSLLLLIATLAMLGCDLKQTPDDSTKNAPAAANPSLDFDWQGITRHVVDGDSLYIGDMDTQIRLWGVDAPERDERGYQAAKQALVDQALKKPIGCIKKDIDKYGRIVARCFQKNGQEINRFLIESGVSQEYCRFSNGFYGSC